MSNLIANLRQLAVEACECECRTAATQLAYAAPIQSVNIGGGTTPWLARGMLNLDGQDGSTDFNQDIPLASGQFNVVLCEQVIEHLHNTTQFLSEIRRIMAPGGTLLLSTESLSSIPNRLALLFGMAPFSLQPCCGKYYGGWKQGKVAPSRQVPRTAPAWSGLNGHVRVLTARQLRLLIEEASFKIQKTRSWFFGHYIMVQAKAQ